MLTDRIADLHSALDAVLAQDTVGVGRDVLLDAVRGFETFRRRMAVVDHQLIAAVHDQGLAAELCMTSTAALLRQLLRISPQEASARVRAAADMGPRRSLQGEVLGPLFARVAAAQGAGVISADHARVVVRAVDKIPGESQAEYEGPVESELVARAAEFDPVNLARVATHLLDVLNPDGTLTDDADHQRRREFLLVRHRDGSSSPAGYFSPAVTALIDAFLDGNAAPRPADDVSRDPRSAGQRNHDALQDGLTHLVGCAAPAVPSGGTLLLTMTAAEYESRVGLARTAHGDLISIPTAVELVSGGQQVSVLFDPDGGVMSYGQTRRLVPPTMRLAITARDQGCTFPGCDRPPAWTQAHHFREFAAENGPTAVDNCGLVCGFHHRNFAQRGWEGLIINGRPHWRPPAWIDPDRVPRRNTTRDPPRRSVTVTDIRSCGASQRRRRRARSAAECSPPYRP